MPCSWSLDNGLHYQKREQLYAVVINNEHLPPTMDNIPNHPTILELAQFANLVYEDVAKQEQHLKNGNWTLVAAAGSESNCYFGCAYYHERNKQLVIAHRGTTHSNLTEILQNIVFTDVGGIILNKDVPQISAAITFTHTILNILCGNVNECMIDVFITGHSLGGWLSQITTYTLKHFRLQENNFLNEYLDADENHVSTVVFDSPGCRNALLSLHGMRYSKVESHIGTLNITTYLSGPSRINSINEHVGTIYEISKDLNVHSMLAILEKLEKINCQSEMMKVEDWPIYVPFRNELSVGQQARSQYHRDDCSEAQNSARYKIVKVKRNECSVNVFNKTERIFLSQYIILLKFPDFFRNVFSSIDNAIVDIIVGKLGKLTELYNIDDNVFRLNSETQSLDNFIPFLRRVGRVYRQVFENAINAVNTNEIRKTFYQGQSSIYISSYIESFDLKFKTNTADDVTLFDKHLCQIIPTNDTRLKITKIYHNLKLQEKFQTKISDFLTILEMKHLLFLNETIKISDYLLAMQDHILIVECNKTVDAFDFDVSIRKMLNHFANMKKVVPNGELIQIIFVSHIEDQTIEKYLPETLKFHKSDVNDALQWHDLSEESKAHLLEMKVNFQGVDESVSIKQLIGSNDEALIDEILDFRSVMSLVENKTTVMSIGLNMQSFNNFETKCCKIYEQFPKKNLLKLFDSIDNLFFIGSGCDRFEDFISGFDSSQYSNINKNSFIFSNSEHPSELTQQFENVCNENLYKTVYWLDHPTSATVFCQQVYCHNFYLKREFIYMSDIVLDGKIFNEFTKKELKEKFVLMNVADEEQLKTLCVSKRGSNEFRNFSSHITNRNITNLNEFNEERISSKLKQMNSNDNHFPVHFIEVVTECDETRKFVWNRSFGSVETIHKYIKREEKYLEEKDFYDYNETMFIIADEPGMGKTTTGTSLLTQLKSSFVIRVNLKDCSNGLASLYNRQLEVDNVVNFLKNAYTKELGMPLTLNLLKSLIMGKPLGKRVYIFFDGFDEIKEEEINLIAKKKCISGKEIAIKLIQYLQTDTKAYVVVTTREHTKAILENSVSKFAIRFKKIDNGNQILFLMNFWNKWLPLQLMNYGVDEIERAEKYAGNLLRDASKLFGDEISNFIGIPLQLRMIVETFVPKQSTFMHSIGGSNRYNMGNIADIYAKYIARKIDIYLIDKVQIEPSTKDRLKDVLTEQFETYHRYFAFELLFPCESIVPDISDFKANREARLQELYRIGIIKFASCDSLYEFSHRTFAEYFVAAMCFDLIFPDKMKEPTRNSFKPHPDFKSFFKREIVAKPENRIVRLFLDCHFSKVSHHKEAMTFISKAYGLSKKGERNLPPACNVFETEKLPNLTKAFYV